MTKFGFRLFDLTLRRGRKQAPIPFQEAGPSRENPRHFRELALELLADLEGRLLVGEPKVQSAEGAGEEVDAEGSLQSRLLGQTAFRFEQHRTSEGLIVGQVRRGRYGSHDQAMGPEDGVPDVPLTGYAPSSTFRYILNLPDNGTHALLVVEDISRAAPVDLIIKWLGQRGREMAENTPPTTDQLASPDWYRLVGRQVTDPQHLEQVLKSGLLGEVTLVKKSEGADRSKSSTPYRVTAPQIREGAVTEARKLLTGWMPDAVTGRSPVTDAEGASQLAALVAPELADLPWDDGQIAIPGSGGRPIKPSRITELFTYEQNPPERRSPGVAFYRSVRAVAARLDVLAEADEPGLEWPDEVNLEFGEEIA